MAPHFWLFPSKYCPYVSIIFDKTNINNRELSLFLLNNMQLVKWPFSGIFPTNELCLIIVIQNAYFMYSTYAVIIVIYTILRVIVELTRHSDSLNSKSNYTKFFFVAPIISLFFSQILKDDAFLIYCYN